MPVAAGRRPTREPADLPRRRQVALEQRGESDRTSALLSNPCWSVSSAGSSARVDVERQQVADGVRVLGAVQPMGDRPSRIRPRRRRLVEAPARGPRRTRSPPPCRAAGGRTAASGPLRSFQRPFPHLGIGADSCVIDAVERQAAGPEPLVVTGRRSRSSGAPCAASAAALAEPATVPGLRETTMARPAGDGAEELIAAPPR